MSRWIAFALGLLLSAGCATGGEPEDLTSADEADRMEEVEFLDSIIFDGRLSAALRRQPTTVVVEPASPFNVNDIPGRIDKWLFVVQDSGGQVATVEEKPYSERGLVTEAVDIIILITKYAVEKQTYGPAAQYDATIYHDESGQVRKVTFTMR